MIRYNPSWIHISYIKEITTDTNFISCDTRDFCIMRLKKKLSKDEDLKLYRVLHGAKINEKHLMKASQIIPFLKELERISGGQAEWRCLNFTSVKTRSGWLKYILFVKYGDDMYAVMDDDYKLIDYGMCQEKYLEKEYLHTH